MACGPREAAAARAWPGRTPPGVRLRHEVGGDPDRRAPSVGGLREGEAGTGWAGVRRWAGGGGLAREGERKKKGEVGLGWNQGRKRERKKKGFAFFLKLFQTIQFKFKFREFKFKLNNKQ